MIDRDGIERPDDPHAHMVENSIAARDEEIDENYNFINKNVIFRAFSRFFRRIVIMFMGPWLKRRYKLKIVGKDNIKKVRRKGVIVTVNHVHNFDNLLVGTRLLHHRKCYFITLKDNINSVKAMPPFDACITELLKKKKAILICPEASLWPYYRGVRPFKKGAFRFAVKNNVPILPVVISFRRKLRKRSAKKGKEKYKYYFTVHVGEPIYQDNNLEIRRQTIDLTDRTYEFYKSTMDEFYKDEEKIEQEYRAELIKSNKKIARNLKPKLPQTQEETIEAEENLKEL